MPESQDEFVEFDLDGADLWIHKEVLEKAMKTGFVRFHFGLDGWCRVELTKD